MKLLLLAENWSPRIGGIENYLIGIATSLPKESVIVVSPTQQKTGEEIAGVTVVRKRFFWPFLKPAWLPLFFTIKNIVVEKKIDIIFAGKTLFEGLLAYYVKKFTNTPYVVFTYAMEIKTWSRTQPKNVRKVLQAADRVVYINDVTKKDLLALGVHEQQLVKIWPGIHDNWLADVAQEKKAAVLQKYNLTKPYIICGARLIERKGIDTVIEAFGTIHTDQSMKLVIFGDGPQKEQLQQLAKKQSDVDILFLGYVPEDDLSALYAGAQFFVLTPKEIKDDMEGFGIVYLEAASQGLAVIGTLTGGVPEAVLHKQTGILVQPNNVPALREALELLIQNEEMRKNLGQAGKTRVWHEFRWSKRILLIKGMIDAILAEKIMQNRR